MVVVFPSGLGSYLDWFLDLIYFSPELTIMPVARFLDHSRSILFLGFVLG